MSISFSPDSMCSFEPTHAHQPHEQMPTIRSETLTLFPADDHFFWNKANQYCTIPEWMHGEYQHLSINDKQIVYRDHASFKTYTMECVHLRDDSAANATQQSGKMLAFSRTQCGMCGFCGYVCVCVNLQKLMVTDCACIFFLYFLGI